MEGISIPGQHPGIVMQSSTTTSRRRNRSTRLPSGYAVVTERFTTGTALGFGPLVYTTVITRSITASDAASTSLSSQTSDNAFSSQSSSVAANTSAAQSSASAGALTGQSAGSASHHNSNGISGGAIAAAVIVPILVIAAIIAAIFFFLRRRKQKKRLSQASSVRSFDNAPPPEMAFVTGNRESMGPPTLNHIVPGELDREIEAPADTRARRWSGVKRGPSGVVRKPVPAATRDSMPQLGEDILRPVSPINDASGEAQRDPFATPTPSSYANSPEDGPNYLGAAAAGSSIPTRGPTPSSKQDELFMSTPTPAAGVGRHWHSNSGSTTSRFNGRDPRGTNFEGERPMSPGGETVSDIDEDETVEIGEATAAPAHRQRASVIDMEKLHLPAGSPPKEGPL